MASNPRRIGEARIFPTLHEAIFRARAGDARAGPQGDRGDSATFRQDRARARPRTLSSSFFAASTFDSETELSMAFYDCRGDDERVKPLVVGQVRRPTALALTPLPSRISFPRRCM